MMSSICPECKFLIICNALHKDSIIECEDFENKQKTNADYIRSMTDEELAMWINNITTNALSVLTLGNNKQTKTIFYWLDWLKKEAKNEEEE